jgi:hypothetical protein
MGKLLTVSSALACPHGGTVSATSSNTRTKAGGDFVLRGSDTFTVAGCAFALPNGTPHPCVTVQWIVTAMRGSVLHDKVLTADSVGLCKAGDQVPQGTVLISSTQARVGGT